MTGFDLVRLDLRNNLSERLGMVGFGGLVTGFGSGLLTCTGCWTGTGGIASLAFMGIELP